jgi:threonine synthase
MCGNSHTGSFKDLGMTVLVSVVKQMIADGVRIGAVACASTGDTSAALAAYAAAAGIPAVVILPRAKVSAAQLVQPLANGALCSRSTPTSTAACDRPAARRRRGRVPRQLDEQPAARGPEDAVVEIVQQFDWECPTSSSSRAATSGNVSALGAGFDMMRELGLIAKRRASSSRRRQRPIRCTAPIRTTGSSSR